MKADPYNCRRVHPHRASAACPYIYIIMQYSTALCTVCILYTLYKMCNCIECIILYGFKYVYMVYIVVVVC